MKRAKAIVTILLVVNLVACTAKQAYATVGVTVHTVDLAMNAWGEYVRAGSATQEQQDKVRMAFKKYQEAVVIARTVLLATDQTPTPQDLISAASAVIDLIQTFTGKTVVTK